MTYIHACLRVLVKTALISALSPLPLCTAQNHAGPVRNVVLVHGAWADGTSWAKIIPLLEAKGLHVTCVQNPLTSFADDVAATKRAIDAQDGPVLLVGHSYGGAVITEAGNNPKVSGLVYVAAFAPDSGESAGALGAKYPKTPGVQELRPIGDGFLVLTPKGVMEDFAPDLSQAERSILVATEAPTQGAALGASITSAAWRMKPDWFVVASNDRMIDPAQERDSARKMNARVLSVETSHVPMLSKPSAVADFIVDAAAFKNAAVPAGK